MVERKREVSPPQAFERMARYCSTSERASSDVIRLVRGYGLCDSVASEIVKRLTALGFLNVERYVTSFVRSKSRAGWGKHKISAALRAKHISTLDIEAALQQIDPDSSKDRLLELVSKKLKSTKYTSIYDLKGKLIRFSLSRGFDYDECLEIVDQLLSSIEQE